MMTQHWEKNGWRKRTQYGDRDVHKNSTSHAERYGAISET